MLNEDASQQQFYELLGAALQGVEACVAYLQPQLAKLDLSLMAVELVKHGSEATDAVMHTIKKQMEEREDELSKQKHKKDILLLLSNIASSNNIVNFDAQFLSHFDSTLEAAGGERGEKREGLATTMRDM